jgi:hypothetical protein
MELTIDFGQAGLCAERSRLSGISPGDRRVDYKLKNKKAARRRAAFAF